MGLKWWHYAGIALFTVAVFIGLSDSVGMESAAIYIGFFYSIAIAALALYFLWYKKRGAGIRGLTIAEAKYIAALHLRNYHHMDMLSNDGGNPDPTVTKYATTIWADRCFPSAGEEAWHIRLRVEDKRYFSGLPTKIIIFMDGGGNVISDKIMNASTFMNEEMWTEPETWFRKFTAKTPKPMSLKEILARKVEDSGEIPSDIGAEIVKEEMEGAPKKVE